MSEQAKPVAEKRHMTDAEEFDRIWAVCQAAEIVGFERLAKAAGMNPRTFRSHTNVERTMPDTTLIAAANGLDAICADLQARASKMRKLAGVDGAE
ncbi:hypothetical protein [Stakelama pacifica]|uniref:Uncharacterized protein n=1 Tax=Stakelama pacifica TaxID=517720 RepID=A0A4R6FN09_9SPHN|nr:hypothetical protein [Stakelama pacifica]TDN82986.1 hypothetical protein EV664_105184 [Stakelama pacifica]GGO94999.1 hypothetical protein GCM10011329_18150 [Stakelama pacifica]